MKWQLEWAQPALNDLGNLDTQVGRQVERALARLAQTGHGDLIRLKKPEQGWRLRVRDWRVFLDMDGSTATITIMRIEHRSRAYKRR